MGMPSLPAAWVPQLRGQGGERASEGGVVAEG